MQLVDRNGGFKNWNTLKHEHYLQNILYFQWMQRYQYVYNNAASFYSKLESPYCSKSNFKGTILDTYNNG